MLSDSGLVVYYCHRPIYIIRRVEEIKYSVSEVGTKQLRQVSLLGLIGIIGSINALYIFFNTGNKGVNLKRVFK